MQYLTMKNILLAWGALGALVNAVRAFAPNGSKLAYVCDRILALNVDLHKLLNVAPDSPQIPRALAFFLLFVSVGNFFGCAGAKSYAKNEIDCTLTAVTMQEISQADAALNSNGWRGALDSLLGTVGEQAGLCAIEGAVAAAETALSGASAMTIWGDEAQTAPRALSSQDGTSLIFVISKPNVAYASASVFVSKHEVCSRGYSYLESHGFRPK